jgi:hypothetical protein
MVTVETISQLGAADSPCGMDLLNRPLVNKRTNMALTAIDHRETYLCKFVIQLRS